MTSMTPENLAVQHQSSGLRFGIGVLGWAAVARAGHDLHPRSRRYPAATPAKTCVVTSLAPRAAPLSAHDATSAGRSAQQTLVS
jgi:hypothetical protein